MKNKHPKYLILWQKWYDPITQMQNQVKSHIRTNNLNSANTEVEPSMLSIPVMSTPMMSTPMGLVPAPVPDIASFNFWVGHTNFIITNSIAKILDTTVGIEALDLFSPYRFRIAIGKAFNEESIKKNIATLIHKYLTAYEQTQNNIAT